MNKLEKLVLSCPNSKINVIPASNQTRDIDGELNQSPCSIVRYFVASLGLLCAIVSCYAQMVFCIAIVEMVIPSNDGNLNNNLTNIHDHSCPIDLEYKSFYDEWRFRNSSITNINNAENNQTSNQPELIYHDRFNWDASQQGLLLGASAIGAAPLQVLGGRMAEIYGAKWVLFAAGFGTAITNFLVPHIAGYSYFLLIIIRIIMGISQSGMESALMCLFAEWLAPTETSFFISMLLFAICIGCFLGSLCSGYLLTLGLGWPITYYVAAGVSFLWSILWLVFATSKPHDHRFISKIELSYILSKQRRERTTTNRRSSTIIAGLLTNGTNSNQDRRHSDLESYTKTESPTVIPSVPFPIPSPTFTKSASAPWCNILSTPQVWVFIITKISVRWCADIITIELPTYLANVLHLSIKLNGLLNSISAALFAVFSFISGCVANKLLKTRPGGLSKTNIRKIIQAVASFGGAIGLFFMTSNDCSLMITISMLMLLSCCIVFGTGGELQIPFDMTSEYPGTLHGLACTLSVSGWLAPSLVGLVLGDQPNSRARWSIVWYSTALISFVGGLVFVLFADASPINFDNPECGCPDGKELDKMSELVSNLSSSEKGLDIVSKCDDPTATASTTDNGTEISHIKEHSTTLACNGTIKRYKQHYQSTASQLLNYLLCSRYRVPNEGGISKRTNQQTRSDHLLAPELPTNTTWSNDHVTITHL